MRTLVLGGTHHVGRAVVEAALERGDDVTTLNRGQSGKDDPRVDARRGDRLDAPSVEQALAAGEWDLVVDTWSTDPAAVATTARLLSGRAGHYAYVSSRSVYRAFVPGSDESAAVVDADPDATSTGDYAADKRGGELAVDTYFDGPATHARAGLILGPYELMGRLPFWLLRTARGDDVPAPGPPSRPLQYVDARDLAAWLLSAPVGVFNTVSEPGHTTIGELLEDCAEVTGAGARLVWLTPETIAAAGVEPWTELPIWLPPDGEYAGLHDCDVSAALGAGLRCRPVRDTVEATWAWVRGGGFTPRTGRAGAPMDAAAEQRLWDAHRAAGSSHPS